MRLLLPLVIAAPVVLGGCDIERNPPTWGTRAAADTATPVLAGLQTVIYHVRDLETASDWYAQLLGYEPYFDEPFYVGFHVGAYELGLDPDTTEARPGVGGTVAYWTVRDVDVALARALALGALPLGAVQQVGGGVRTASVRDPFGNVLGLIDNPAFRRQAR